ncbi:hypothetical protein HETIRDRAFT_429487 [Heterobasidion irregulare TC 32-1]|uniref:Uncharacterized protein n=1 Tax=Heterobasidion irregulare (strain TC 32-1) TaxID=747525 RepID=W4JW88_HETIT|nr:uncharacterized protein HETIRDRAFT_429487 [Heterobasidion irregulare TC 32-1]ETW77156.1 hypothetical protein HETIRDRAFT_429487 [Heterobasidion irregulare TC 32-1]
MAKLEFEFLRVQEVVDEVSSMLIESMSRNIKVLHGELGKAIAKNNQLEEKLEATRQEITDWMAETDTFKVEMKRLLEGHNVREAGGHCNSILSFSQIPSLSIKQGCELLGLIIT